MGDKNAGRRPFGRRPAQGTAPTSAAGSARAEENDNGPRGEHRQRVTGVLVVAPRGDPHGNAVQQGLRLAGAVTARAALDIAGTCFSHRPGEGLRLDGQVISSAWTVWWHRTGTLPPVPGADPPEQELAQAEAAALLLGALAPRDRARVGRRACDRRARRTHPAAARRRPYLRGLRPRHALRIRPDHGPGIPERRAGDRQTRQQRTRARAARRTGDPRDAPGSRGRTDPPSTSCPRSRPRRERRRGC